MKYFGLFMCIFYAGVSAAFLFTDAFSTMIPRYRLALGLLLAGYAVVRAYMWRQKYGHKADT